MGFFEILLIAVIALLVVGPQRMPEAVRTVALTVGRFKRGFNNARSEIEKQIGADEIRQQLHNETIMANLEKVQGDVDEVNKAFEDQEANLTEKNTKSDSSNIELNDSKKSKDLKKDTEEEATKPNPSEHLP